MARLTYITEEEKKEIALHESTNDQIELLFQKRRGEWNTIVAQQIKKTHSSNFVEQKINIAHDSQMENITYRQDIADEIATIEQKVRKAQSKYSDLKAKKSLYYKTEFIAKTNNNAETAIYVEGSLREYDREINIYAIYMDFLKSTKSAFDGIGYAYQYHQKYQETFRKYV